MVIFGCGVVTGALLITTVGHRTFWQGDSAFRGGANNNSPSPLQIQRVEFLHRMERQLNLTSEQRDRIGKIMRASQDRTKPLWELIAPQMRREVKRVEEEIREELTPEQQKKFAELLKPRAHKSEATSVPGDTQPGAERSRTNSP